jgi:hypothetical protein
VLDEATVAGEARKSGGGTAAASTGSPAAKSNSKSSGLLAGLNGLQGQGPQSGPGTSTQPGSAGGQLDSSAIQRTVSNYSAGVRRSCWQPALDTRSKDAPSSARVNVSVTVAPSGTVQNVSTGGDPRGYRGLANCIASKVRGWKFPRSSGTTTVNIPFVFAAQ